MNQKLPRSPFTTRLSGSARETELRIRSIFQWKKKRPPAALIILALAAILLCGNLVACQTSNSPGENGSDTLDQQSVWNALVDSMETEIGVLDDRDPLSYTMLASVSREGRTLAAMSVTDFYPHYVLGVGVVGDDGQLVGDPFTAVTYGGMPHVTTFQKDGADYLLYTCNGMHQGLSWGVAGLIRFDGGDFTWVWPVEGDVRDTESQAFADYQAYWEDHLALMAPGGVDVFYANSYYDLPPGPYSGAQWCVDHNEIFWPAPEADLPMPVYYQTRVWLEEFSRYQHNPWNSIHASADWRILSLTPNSWVYPDQTDGQQGYTLLAQADCNDDLYLGVHLIISEETGTVTAVNQYVQGDYDLVSGKLAEYDESAQRTATAADALPIPDGQDIELEFCSGAGAWQTVLTLNRDGSFTGEYSDADMGDNTVYVCSFRGRFGHFQQLSDNTYSMTLDELELTTGHPVGGEWMEGGVRHVSSEPYGLDGGTDFRFYTPETPTMDLPERFLLWFNDDTKDQLLARTGPLGRYGLYNREMEYGFFSYEDR